MQTFDGPLTTTDDNITVNALKIHGKYRQSDINDQDRSNPLKLQQHEWVKSIQM